MTTFIGSEYLIGFCLLRQSRIGNDSISFPEVRHTARVLQEALNSANVDAVVIDHSLVQTIAEFGDYFQMIEINGVPYVKCNHEVTPGMLERRFVGYLPLDVLEIAIKVIGWGA